jgi:hypothetical protein
MITQKGKAVSDTTRPSTARTVVNDEQAKAETGSIREDGRHGSARHTDPDNYLYAKKKLKKAVLEHYR